MSWARRWSGARAHRTGTRRTRCPDAPAAHRRLVARLAPTRIPCRAMLRDPRSSRRACSAARARPSVLAACAAAGRVVRPDRRRARPTARAPGAYPDLEALDPDARTTARRRRRLDSGRNCTPDEPRVARRGAGISEVRFAGGTWTFGDRAAVVLAVFTRAGPDRRPPRRLLREQRRATAAPDDRSLGQTSPTIAGPPGPPARHPDRRAACRSVVVWPSADDRPRQRRDHQRPPGGADPGGHRRLRPGLTC